MIFTDKNIQLSELAKYFKICEVDDETIEIGMEYLDVKKPRNNELLKKIKITEISADKSRIYLYTMQRAVHDQIVRSHDKELLERYVLFCTSFAGSFAYPFIAPLLGYPNNYSDAVKAAFRSFTNDDHAAEGMMIALMTDANGNGAYLYHNKESLLPEDYMCGAMFAASNSNNKTLSLAAKALNGLLKEKAENKDSEREKKISKVCVDLMKKILFNGEYVYQVPYYSFRAFLAEMAFFDEESRRRFRNEMKNKPENLITDAKELCLDLEKILGLVVSEKVEINDRYVETAIGAADRNTFDAMKTHLFYLAREYKKYFIEGMNKLKDAVHAKKMLDIVQEIYPDHDGGELKEKAQKDLIHTMHEATGRNIYILAYLNGMKTLPEIWEDTKDINFFISSSNDRTNILSYCKAYGMDELVKRCITIAAVFTKNPWAVTSNIYAISLLSPDSSDKSSQIFTDILFEEKVPVEKIVELSTSYKSLAKYADIVAELDTASFTAEMRCKYLLALNAAGAEKYRDKIFEAADDTSKQVRATLVKIVPELPDCHKEIEDILKAKKAAKRETAIEIIAAMNDGSWKETLEAALEKERSEKLRTKLESLLGISGEGKKAGANTADLVTELTKGNKTRKLSWLYESEYPKIHFTDGSEADEKYMKSILLCYSGEDYKNGELLAKALDPAELAAYAAEVMGRWISAGAAAKNKWVLIFAAIWGGTEMIATFVYYIKYWSDNMRGAMAVAAVKALALNGSPEALMQIDNFARKYKSNQVKAAANTAMAEAADFLGITAEELGDRIVPDMGFDDRMCRVFDYGKRQFNVYLLPTLEIEIWNGDKKIKNLPKPGANDSADIADKSYAEFKEMKKQLKSVIAIQKARLEYTFICDRKWTAENWKKLFVKNPVMHSFAIGLIWGVYEDDKLISTFRYMDDGSFTTVDEDEFELPENGSISLVHPVELTESEISAWSEQLEDYEIVQPFSQLTRKIYRPTEEELETTEITRFRDKRAMNLTFLSKMTKNGWFKGTAQDGGWFYEFKRCDISRCVKDEQGKSISLGNEAELEFSGMYIAAYGMGETEEIDIGKLSFYDPSEKTIRPMKIKEVNKRYFSEIIMQLNEIIGEGS